VKIATEGDPIVEPDHDWDDQGIDASADIDDFLTVGTDRDTARDLFAILANREHRLPTMIASQTGLAHWVAELSDRVAADSIVNRLANNARVINLGQIDMRRLRNDQARAHETYWE